MKNNFAKIADSGEGKWKGLARFALFSFTAPGRSFLFKTARKLLRRWGVLKTNQVSYTKWINGRTDPKLLRQEYEAHISELNTKPLISIIITPHKADTALLQSTIDSIAQQSYQKCRRDAQSATIAGDWVLFLEEGDVLPANCLFEFVRHINTYSEQELIYSDEDSIDQDGKLYHPHFKPRWSPDTLLSGNYIGNAMMIKRELLAKVGAYTGIYDLLLRATELSSNIGHITGILYHKRTVESTISEKLAVAGKQALEAAMLRRNTPAQLSCIDGSPASYHIKYQLTTTPKVSIIIPTKDQAGLLRAAIDSILQLTDYPDYEIIVLNNNSTSAEFFILMNEYEQQHKAVIRCVDAAFPFNYARLMNLGAAESRGQYLLMLNNDVTVIPPDWITQMVGYAQRPHTGAVGVKLLYPDDTIQHAGIVLGINADAGHVFAHKPRKYAGHFNYVQTLHNYAAVTGACMMCRKELYTEAGGMDERLVVEYNDLDLCLSFLQRGYYNVYLPTVELYHYESATRGHPFRSIKSFKQHEKDFGIFSGKWQTLIDNDPYYNPNLSKADTDFNLSQP